jgi:predicted MFS family arabinose efflux permease
VLYVVAIALYLSITSLGPMVYVVRFLDGVASTMWYAALFTLGADLVPASRRTEGLAIFGAAGLITIGLGAQFGDAILTYAGYRAVFLGSLGCAVVGLLLSLTLRDVSNARASASGRPARGLFAAATQSNLQPIWYAAFVFFVAMGGLFFFLKTFVAINVGSVGGFFTAYAIALALRLFLG